MCRTVLSVATAAEHPLRGRRGHAPEPKPPAEPATPNPSAAPLNEDELTELRALCNQYAEMAIHEVFKHTEHIGVKNTDGLFEDRDWEGPHGWWVRSGRDFAAGAHVIRIAERLVMHWTMTDGKISREPMFWVLVGHRGVNQHREICKPNDQNFRGFSSGLDEVKIEHDDPGPWWDIIRAEVPRLRRELPKRLAVLIQRAEDERLAELRRQEEERQAKRKADLERASSTLLG